MAAIGSALAGLTQDATAKAQRPLVPVNFRGGSWYFQQQGTGGNLVDFRGSLSSNGANAGQASYNDQGKYAGLVQMTMTAAAASTGGHMKMFGQFGGTSFGLRFVRNSATAGLTVVIDGIAYPVPVNVPRLENSLNSGFADEGRFIVAHGTLPEGLHSWAIFLSPDLAQAAARTTNITGLLLDKDSHDQLASRFATHRETIAVPTSATAITTGALTSTGWQSRAVRKILLSNTAGTATRITFAQGATPHTIKTLDLAASGPGNVDTGEFDFGEATTLDPTFTILASQAGAFYTPIFVW